VLDRDSDFGPSRENLEVGKQPEGQVVVQRNEAIRAIERNVFNPTGSFDQKGVHQCRLLGIFQCIELDAGELWIAYRMSKI
jgi:hypothetical protein